MSDEGPDVPIQSEEQQTAEHHSSYVQPETQTEETKSVVEEDQTEKPKSEEDEKINIEEPNVELVISSKVEEKAIEDDKTELRPSVDGPQINTEAERIPSIADERTPQETETEKKKSEVSELPERERLKSNERQIQLEEDQPLAKRESLVETSSKGAIPSKEEKQSLPRKETKKSKTSVDGEEKKNVPALLSSDSLEGKRESKEAKKTRSDRLSGKAKNVVGSIIDIRRLSTTGEFFDRIKGARYMNTYKLDSDNPFNSDKVKKILEAVMIEALENLTYDPEKCPKQAKWASSAIRAKVKELQFDRYKLICLVTIGEKNSQDVLVTCRFLWDVDRDRYASYCIENTYVFGIALCFGIYYE